MGRGDGGCDREEWGGEEEEEMVERGRGFLARSWRRAASGHAPPLVSTPGSTTENSCSSYTTVSCRLSLSLHPHGLFRCCWRLMLSCMSC